MYSKNQIKTPWGEGHINEVYLPGSVFGVTTPSHGGIMIEKSYAKINLSKAARAKAIPCGQFIGFEEDCRWVIPVFELPWLCDQIKLRMPDLDHEYMLKWISYWDADYLIERKITPEPESFKAWQSRQADKRLVRF
jgi:hypothetical protein